MKSTDDRPDAAERSLAIIDRQVAQLVRLVDDLLDVSRITSGKLEIRTEPVRLRDVVQSAIDTIMPRAGAHEHPLRIDLPDEDVYVAADRVRLAQILGNLLHNAVKFSKPRGVITLSAAADGDMVRIRVSDEGVGIPAEALDRIFEMFTQNGAPVGQVPAGLGVGLALARQLAELHGGTVEAASEGPGKGATFTLRIPGAARPAVEEGAASPPSEDVADVARVLVVDDNKDFAQSLAELLKAYGHEVAIAYDGEHALAIAGEFRPQFGLLDIGLPSMDGYELARQLRSLPWADNLILVAISGWGQEQDRRRSRAAGFALHLVKPVQYPVVQAALRGFLEERSA
jgi:CheY-like chemotaxis protein